MWINTFHPQNNPVRYTLLLFLKLSPSSAAWQFESQTPETGAGGKESGLFKCQSFERMGGLLSSKTHLNISGQASDFYRVGGNSEGGNSQGECGCAVSLEKEQWE